MAKNTKIIVIANKIRSLYNIGSIFRTGDAVQLEKLFLAGYTATPKEQKQKIHKTALGAEDTVPWEKIKYIAPMIKKFRNENYEIIGLEIIKGKSLDYRRWQPKKKVVIIIGNEIKGLEKPIVKLCDKIIHLPMNGVKGSLNVSVSLGAILFYILAKNKT